MNKSRGNTVAKQKVSRLRTGLMIAMLLITSVSLSLVWSAPTPINVAALGGLIDRRPVGTSIEGYWTTPPSGYLLEDGSAVSRTTYAGLFSVIGTTFGSGDGSTTFNLPDSRGKVTVAFQSGDSDFGTLGQTGGEKYHTLTLAELAAHDHDFTGHTIYWGAGGNTYFRQAGGNNNRINAVGGGTVCGSNQPCGSTWLYTCQNCSGWVDTDNSGGGGAHNNIQPYIVLNRAIKY